MRLDSFLRLSFLVGLSPFLIRCGGDELGGQSRAAAEAEAGAPGPDARGEAGAVGRDAGVADAPEVPASTLPTRSAGCGTAAQAQVGTKQISVSGTNRSFVLSVPEGYDPQRAYPIVAVFHGIGATGEEMANFIKMQDYSAGDAIVAFPSAANGAWDLGGETDLHFFDALLGSLASTLCVNEQRVFALGFSYGAYMVNHLGCERSTVRAVAAAAGGFGGGSQCGKTAALVYHRADDDNEAVSNGRSARDRWLTTNGCSQTSRPLSGLGFDGLGCVHYDNCAPDKPVVWCEDTNVDPPVYRHDLRGAYRVPIWKWFAQF